jgi:hypothetical protein
MSFVANSSQQISLDDSLSNLTERERKMLEKSWAQDFSEHIFPKINEAPFSVLYSDPASRPNTPVNVILGALMIKDILDMTDDEILEAMMFDIRFQHALHTTSFKEQPFSDRTLSRFRKRCLTYEAETGIDLIRECITRLSAEMAGMMKINSRLSRTDSLMIASNIKKMSRLELIYTCVSDLATFMHKVGEDDQLAGLEHYYDSADRNRVIYHSRSTDTDERLRTILDDADRLLSICNGGYDDVMPYQLLVRVISEQTLRTESGQLRMKTKEDGGMNPGMLQNPSDPDATYREKAGKHHKGYAANIVESVGETGSIISGYQYEQNVYSDSRFLQDMLETMDPQAEETILVADGAYSGAGNADTASSKNVRLVTTDLTGRQTKEIYADFQFSEDGSEVISCAAGHRPKSCSTPNANGQCRISFNKNICEQCPHKNECQPKVSNKTAVIFISAKSVARANAQREMKTDAFRQLQKFRNGVESIPSTLRRKYNVDRMPVRGLNPTRLWFGFKVAAFNCKKLFDYLKKQDKCVLFPAVA